MDSLGECVNLPGIQNQAPRFPQSLWLVCLQK